MKKTIQLLGYPHYWNPPFFMDVSMPAFLFTQQELECSTHTRESLHRIGDILGSRFCLKTPALAFFYHHLLYASFPTFKGDVCQCFLLGVRVAYHIVQKLDMGGCAIVLRLHHDDIVLMGGVQMEHLNISQTVCNPHILHFSRSHWTYQPPFCLSNLSWGEKWESGGDEGSDSVFIAIVTWIWNQHQTPNEVNVYIYIYIYIYTYTYTYSDTHTNIYIYIHTDTDTYTYTCIGVTLGKYALLCHFPLNPAHGLEWKRSHEHNISRWFETPVPLACAMFAGLRVF